MVAHVQWNLKKLFFSYSGFHSSSRACRHSHEKDPFNVMSLRVRDGDGMSLKASPALTQARSGDVHATSSCESWSNTRRASYYKCYFHLRHHQSSRPQHWDYRHLAHYTVPNNLWSLPWTTTVSMILLENMAWMSPIFPFTTTPVLVSFRKISTRTSQIAENLLHPFTMKISTNTKMNNVCTSY